MADDEYMYSHIPKNNPIHNLKGKRPERAGRPKGAKNKMHLVSAACILAEKNIHPVNEILNLIPTLEPKDQLAAWTILLRYSVRPPEPKPEGEGQVLEITYKRAPEKEVNNGD